ncbi:MAG TPA: KUP/HAK/KT family potassium transporter [Nocardioides sp.]|uniref:KUP/HAK/KT family potassium transporter n=1 Tax=Nocardioides sp. TaxID=35761 RepID=UPI002E33B544|nr:KUP/HAK/KT family potassium transporter [Nocardioides sp.]HEX3931088.1 KUP/HAK/KT family potassium transporter [Nocardioides sp.]
MERGPRGGQGSLALVAMGALGVVFGDIGTSPLYALRAVLHDSQATSRSEVYGVTSLVVWALVSVVGLLHVEVLLSADNRGEGGVLALASLLRRGVRRGRLRTTVSVVAMIGAALFLGDSILTPAISVLSASEGLEVAAPSMSRLVVPLALAILCGVFLLQPVGSGRIGVGYGPVMLLWFAVLGVGGLVSLVQTPAVLTALSPTWGAGFLAEHPGTGFVTLGAVVLAVTGAEALYTDLGHFGRRAIATAWWTVVFPALVLAYLGEAAAVLRDPSTAGNPFYGVVPSWATVPVLVLGTLATVIASEAVIAGAFTVLHQAGGLDFFPDLRTIHTSRRHPGQIYQPAANWTLGAAVLLLVVAFRSSDRLANAYGVTVSATVVLTVVLYVVWALRQRPRPWARIGVGTASGLVAALLFAGTLPKLVVGGWVPAAIGAVLFVLMHTWWTGQGRVAARLRDEELTAEELVEAVQEDAAHVRHLEGHAVFLTHDPAMSPLALRSLLDIAGLVPEHVVLLSWEVDDAPSAPPEESSVTVRSLGDDSWDVTGVSVVLGYADRLDVTHILEDAVEAEPDLLSSLEPAEAVFIVSRLDLGSSRRAPWARWRQRVFLAMNRLARDKADQLSLPRARTIVIGRELRL